MIDSPRVAARSAAAGSRTGDLLISSPAPLKLKVHTLDVAPFRSESPLQKRSDMARVLKEFHSFTCTPTDHRAIDPQFYPHTH